MLLRDKQALSPSSRVSVVSLGNPFRSNATLATIDRWIELVSMKYGLIPANEGMDTLNLKTSLIRVTAVVLTVQRFAGSSGQRKKKKKGELCRTQCRHRHTWGIYNHGARA